MATLSETRLESILRDVGFSGESLRIAKAVAKGESGWRTDVKGDLDLQNEKWGPSVGLFQIRCLRSEIGKGTPRDCEALTDPEFNARAAYIISNGGSNWNPWTVYKTGAYKKYLTSVKSTVTEYLSPLRDLTFAELNKLLTTAFGDRKAIGEGAHLGIDLSATEGTPIYAPEDATVKRIYSEAAGGNVLILQGANGVEHVFAHLQRYAVGANAKIKQGQIVGYVGSTGKVTGSHLHWEVKINGKPINPLNLFNPTADVDVGKYAEDTQNVLVETVENFLRDKVKDDIGNKTWREYFSGFNTDFIGAPTPFSFGTFLHEATDELGISDKEIEASDIPTIAQKMVELGTKTATDPLTAIADAFGTVAAAFGFLLNPANWAGILALVAGVALIIAGGRMIWSAV